MSYLVYGAAARQKCFCENKKLCKKVFAEKIKEYQVGKDQRFMNKVAVKCAEQIDFATTE